MFSIHSKKIAAALFASFIAVLSIFIISCQKELSGEGFTITETPPDLTTKINSAVSGFVTDENDAAVNGAAVQVGGTSTTTDKYGYFEVSNVQVVKTAAVVTVIKPGYFKGIKTYIATENKSAFFRIKLIPKNNSGNFDAAAGGTVVLNNGLSVSLPGSAVVVVSSGAAYTGSVNVAAHWLSPTAADLNRIMPGDLRGLDSLGFIKSLTTYGMAAVELTGASGELLQIASGKKATLSFPLPASVASVAPATLPLWYFDESNGLWKQEGHAVKNGNSYVGNVSHFSFWNCDVPANYVRFDCIITDAAGYPVANALVKISVVSNPQNHRYGYTDSSGYTGGLVPDNSQLLLEVFSDYTCAGAIFSQNFTTSNAAVSLGIISIPSPASATVSGTVVNCSNAAVTNGFVILIKDGVYFRHPISSTGTFSFTTTLCNSNSTVTLTAEDLVSMQGGSPTTATLVAGNNTITAALSACGTSLDEFLNYSINGTSYTIVAPPDNLIQEANNQTNPPLIFVSGYVGQAGSITNSASMGFTKTGIAAGSTQTLISFSSRQLSDSTNLTGNTNVNITEYGAVGEFIAGNFTTTLTGAPPANTAYNITVGFRVRRTL